MKIAPRSVLSLLLAFLIAGILGVVFVYRAASRAASMAHAHSAVVSIAAALQIELALTNGSITTLFPSSESGEWQRLSGDRYRLVLSLLADRHNIDIPSAGLDPWGHEYVIECRRKDDASVYRISSRRSDLQSSSEDVNEEFSVGN